MGALDNFWRSAENFSVTSSKTWNNHVTTLWAVSQAAPLRKVHVTGNLDLYQYNSGGFAGYASGGYMADVTVTGGIYSGSQQQFMTRNTQMGQWFNGVWNMVFVGCQGAPATHCGHDGGATPSSNIAATPLIAEKPYITFEGAKYFLQVPKVETNKVGPSQGVNADQIDFSQVYVSQPTDTAAIMNAKLATGLHLVISPGVYNLEDSIKVTKANTVILGLGMATLVASQGKPAITIANVDGVRVAGLLLQAGQTKTDSLLEWGTGTYAGSATAPGVMSDVFARVGGPVDTNQQQVSTDKMILINSSNVIVDNTWLWRADHDIVGLVKNSMNPVQTGIRVNGDNVIAYGLASEHTLGNLVEWYGNNGKVFFYQSEFPYDVTQANYGDKGYVSYYVDTKVTNHQGYGIGVYSYFRDYVVDVAMGISAPKVAGVSFENSVSVFLNGNGDIEHVIDDNGVPVAKAGDQAYVCQFGAALE
jgi:hypothetical protein